MSRERVLVDLVLWLNERVAPDDVTVEADTPLFKGLINSMRVLELIAWTEERTGQVIPDRQIVMDNFRTARRVAEVFAGD